MSRLWPSDLSFHFLLSRRVLARSWLFCSFRFATIAASSTFSWFSVSISFLSVSWVICSRASRSFQLFFFVFVVVYFFTNFINQTFQLFLCQPFCCFGFIFCCCLRIRRRRISKFLSVVVLADAAGLVCAVVFLGFGFAGGVDLPSIRAPKNAPAKVKSPAAEAIIISFLLTFVSPAS